MKIKFETECWRELVTGSHPRAEEMNEGEIDGIADSLCQDVLGELTRNGIEYSRAHGQKVGSFVIVQSATEAEQAAFDSAVEKFTAKFA